MKPSGKGFFTKITVFYFNLGFFTLLGERVSRRVSPTVDVPVSGVLTPVCSKTKKSRLRQVFHPYSLFKKSKTGIININLTV